MLGDYIMYKNKEFEKECKIIKLKYEYRNYDGLEKYAIITDLSKIDLLHKYPDETNELKPFIILTNIQGKAIEDFNRNERKFFKRNQKLYNLFDLKDYELDIDNFYFLEDILEKEKDLLLENTKLKEAIEKLNPIQRRRVIKKFFDGENSREIARQEGVNYSAIDKSINFAIKNLRNFLK